MKKIIIIMLLLSFTLVGCNESIDTSEQGNSTSNSQNVEVSDTITNEQILLESSLLTLDEEFSDKDFEIDNIFDSVYDIVLSDNGSTSTSSSISVSGNVITITDEGSYYVSGVLTNGQIVVETEDTDQVQLILDGVTISNDSTAAVNIVSTDKVFITTEKDSTNTLSSNIVENEDSNIDAVIFSKSDLCLNGEGELVIDGSNANGVTSKDDLKVTSGTYSITADGHAFEANDSIRVSNGTINIISQKDGFHCDNDDVALGYIYITNGIFNINSFADGFDSSSIIQIENGEFNIITGDGSADAEMEATPNNMMQDGQENQIAEVVEEDTISQKAIKADAHISILGGNFIIDAYDDAIHSDGHVEIHSGDLNIKTGDDAVHADTLLEIFDGNLDIPHCFEGLEASLIYIYDGNIDIFGFDDGINAASDTANQEIAIHILGGNISIDVSEEGDGIDSNGDFYVSDGNILISSTILDRDTIVDYNSYGEITGGTILGSGSVSRTRQNFGENSTQGSIMQDLNSWQTGEVTLTDSSGNIIAQFTPAKEYESVLISTPLIKQGESYTLTAGSESYEITMDSLIYGTNSSGTPQNNMPQGGNTQTMPNRRP